MNAFSFSRRTVVRKSAGLAAASFVAVAALTGCAAAATPAANNDAAAAATIDPKPTVVFVHGAWSDASPFAAVEKQLSDDGYTVVNFANPLRSLTTDTTYLASFLETRTEGPVVLVGHSYGGALISGAALSDPDVTSLVYVNGFVPTRARPFSTSPARPAPSTPRPCSTWPRSPATTTSTST